MPAPLLGIDVGTSAVKIVGLSQSGSSYRLDAYAIEPLDDGVVVDQTVRDGDRLAQAIRRALQRSRSRIKGAAIAVSGASVITKIIELDALPSALDMESLVQLEAAQHIPYAIEDVALDFAVLGPSTGQPDRVRVLLAASRRDEVEARVAAVQQAGLDVEVVDIEPLVLARALRWLDGTTEFAASDTLALVDLGHSRSALTVMRDGHSLFRRELPLAGRQLTADIQRHLGVTADDAEQIKRAPDPEADVQQQLLAPFIGQALDAVQQQLQLFSATQANANIDGFLLYGGMSALPGLAAQWQSATGIRTHLLDVAAVLDCAAGINPYRFQLDSSALLMASSLALRGFDRDHR